MKCCPRWHAELTVLVLACSVSCGPEGCLWKCPDSKPFGSELSVIHLIAIPSIAFQ